MNYKVEKRISNLEDELAQVEIQITNLGNRRSSIVSELKKLRLQHYLYVFDSWNIHNNDFVLFFNRDNSGWNLVSGFHIVSIDEEKQNISSIYFDYKDYQNEYKLEFCNKLVSFSELENIQDNNIVVRTDKENYNNFIYQLSNIDFTWSDLNTVRNMLKSSSEFQIIKE